MIIISQVHELDQSLLEALKMSFDDVKNVKEACDVLDTFFSVSERTRIRDLYNLCKEKILQPLPPSLNIVPLHYKPRQTWLTCVDWARQ